MAPPAATRAAWLALCVLLLAGCACAEPQRLQQDCLDSTILIGRGVSLYPAPHQIHSSAPATSLQGFTKVRARRPQKRGPSGGGLSALSTNWVGVLLRWWPSTTCLGAAVNPGGGRLWPGPICHPAAAPRPHRSLWPRTSKLCTTTPSRCMGMAPAGRSTLACAQGSRLRRSPRRWRRLPRGQPGPGICQLLQGLRPRLRSACSLCYRWRVVS